MPASIKWSETTILQALTLLNARSAARGKPCPNSARVVARLEISTAIAEELAR